MKKWLGAAAAFVALVAGLAWALTRRAPARTVTMGVLERAYNCVSLLGEDDHITFEILIDAKKSFASDSGNITSACLTNADGEYLKLEIESVSNSGDAFPVNERTFYLFYFTFHIDFHPETEYAFEMAEAELLIDYRIGLTVCLPVGSFGYYKVATFLDERLSVCRLKGLVNMIDGYKTLAAIDIGLRNDSPSDIVITAIRPLVPELAFAFGEKVDSRDLEYRSDCPIDAILGHAYDFFAYAEGTCNYRLHPGEQAFFLLPLKYRRLLPVDNIGIVVEYVQGGKDGCLVIDDFLFFTTRVLTLKALRDVVFATYENH